MTRFPYKAWQRRLGEAQSMSDQELEKWLNDRNKAKRLAAKQTLRQRCRQS